MLPSVADVLALASLQDGRPLLRAGEGGLTRSVRWVHVAEVADIAHLLDGGELILTTGIALPDTAPGLRRYIAELHEVGASALVIELARRFKTTLPAELVDAAAGAGLPLVELHRETPFVAVTQAVHTLILDARDREGLERQTHRTLLTALAFSATSPDGAAERAHRLGVAVERRQVTGVVITPRADVPDPALLRDVAGQAVAILRERGVAALVGPIDDDRVAVLLSHGRADDADDTLDALARRLRATLTRRPNTAITIGAGSTGTGVDGARHSLREAIDVADTARELAGERAYYRPPDLRLRGLIHALRDHPAMSAFAARELDALVTHDAERGTTLLAFLTVFCRARGNKSAAAAQLFISRAALYDRIAKVQRVLDADLSDPEVVLSLHFAVLARETLRRPDLAVS